MLGVSRVTLDLWGKGRRISDTNRRRLLTVHHIIGLAEGRGRGPAQLGIWLDTPRGVSGVTPSQLLASRRFSEARYLAIAEPSPGTSRSPDWAYRPLSPEEQARDELMAESLPVGTDAPMPDAGDLDPDEWEPVPDE